MNDDLPLTSLLADALRIHFQGHAARMTVSEVFRDLLGDGEFRPAPPSLRCAGGTSGVVLVLAGRQVLRLPGNQEDLQLLARLQRCLDISERFVILGQLRRLLAWTNDDLPLMLPLADALRIHLQGHAAR